MNRNIFISIILSLLVLLSSKFYAQVPSLVNYPKTSCQSYLPCDFSFISASYYDTINEVLYIGGNFNDVGGVLRTNLAAIDLKTGNVLPWSPVVNNGNVYAITKSGNTIYIGGSFTQVNSFTRNNLAAINATTGSLLSWNPNPNNEVNSLATDGTYLYVAGKFTNISSLSRNYLVLFTIATGSLHSWVTPLTASHQYCKKLIVIGNKIYFISQNLNGGNSVFEVAFNSSLAISKANADLNFIHDYSIYNNKLFCVGDFFTINDSVRIYTGAVDLSSNLVLNWNPKTNATYLTTELSIENRKDTMYIGSLSYNPNDTTYNFIKKFSANGTGNYLGLFKYYLTNLYNPQGYYSDSFQIVSDKLIEIVRSHLHGSFNEDLIYSYCFRPFSPGNFTTNSLSVCQGQQGVMYELPDDAGFNSYAWSYSGSGATINGNGDSVTISFSATATSGILSVKGTNFCGLQSPAKTISITVNPSPNVNAGLDDTLTCTQTSVLLSGSSTNPSSSITYVWSGPSGNISTIATTNATSAGTYTLTVTTISTQCSKQDYAQVYIDSAKPHIQPILGNYTLTCLNTSVLLDASTTLSTDSLRWINSSGFGFPDPLLASQPGSYICIAKSKKNGCESRDTAVITSQANLPNINAPLSVDTLTCKVDTVVLQGSSTSSNTSLFWRNPSGDTLPNPVAVTQSALYSFYVTDTINGCSSISYIYVHQNKILPNISMPSGNPSITCSLPTALLDANSSTPNTLLSWQGLSTNFPDPAVIYYEAMYFLTAIDTLNGCSAIDSVYVPFLLTLIVNAVDDTVICSGATAVLSASVVLGYPLFHYTWSNGGVSQGITVNPSDTTKYVVEVTDNAGCYGTDTVVVCVPDIITDSITAFQPCSPTGFGQLQVNAFGGVPPYQYSIDGGNAYQSSSVFDSLLYGPYNLIIKDTMACSVTTSAQISVGGLLPTPDFLVSTHSMESDTLVVVDISNPRPDTVVWTFPSSCQVINDDPFAPVVVNSDTGAFTISMEVHYNDCVMSVSKQIAIHSFDSAYATIQNNNGIESIILYSNPNNGQFNVDIKLYKKQTFVVLIYDAGGVERFKHVVSEDDIYQDFISLNAPLPGTYVLRVIAEYDSRQKVFVVTK